MFPGLLLTLRWVPGAEVAGSGWLPKNQGSSLSTTSTLWCFTVTLGPEPFWVYGVS